jgi:hypothetical protein
LHVEVLEARSLLSADPSVLALPEAEANDTLDQAQDLGNLSFLSPSEAVGAIGNGTTGAADVDWYRFTLDRPARVTLTTLMPTGGTAFGSVLGLYNTTERYDPIFETGDRYELFGHRLVSQAVGGGDGTGPHLDRSLAAGTYYVAVSGAGNRFFHPFLAGSGYPGSTGDYQLQLTATDLELDPNAGPVVLAVDPAPGAVLDQAPLVIRVELSGPLGPDQAGYVRDADGLDIPLQWTNFSALANELQLAPTRALGPGSYTVVITGDSGEQVVTTFEVNGVEGNADPSASADDHPNDPAGEPGGAHDLGEVSDVELLQVAGVIGDDPAYDPDSFDPFLFDRTADVDLYYFRVRGPGRFAFVAEVFANRIGSPLDPGVSLFRVDPSDNRLYLVAANDGTSNDTAATDGTLPLLIDSLLYAALEEGDYYVAISSSGNVPDPTGGLFPGSDGIFDPNVTHTGAFGFRMGGYVLNLQVRPDTAPPEVATVSVADGTTLAAPPTHLVVQFTEEVNLPQLLYLSFLQTFQSQIEAVFVRGEDGSTYYPRLESYDAATNEARFLLLERLPNGNYEWHLSGTLGLADLAGNLLVANDSTGAYVVRFTVDGPVRGTNGNPLLETTREPNDDLAQPQVLGVLFPAEMAVLYPGESEEDFTVARDFTADPSSAPADSADFYQFEVLQSRQYLFNLTGPDLPAETTVTLTDPAGNPVPATYQDNGWTVQAELVPGTYVIAISGWLPPEAAGVVYQLRFSVLDTGDNPPPLTVGPAPALRIRLSDTAPPTPPMPPPPVPPIVPPPPAPPPVVPPAPSPSPVIPPAPPPTVVVPVVPPSPSPAPPPVVVVPVPPDVSHTSPGAGIVVSTPQAEPPLLAGIPQTLLLGLAAGPVGGVTGAGLGEESFASDRVVVRAPNPALLEGLLRLTVLAQTSGSGEETFEPLSSTRGEEAPALPVLIRVIADSLSRWMSTRGHGVDLLFALEGWWEALQAPSGGPDLVPEDSVPEEGNGGGAGLEAAQRPGPGSWVAPLTVLGALAVGAPRKRRATHKRIPV